MTLVNIIDVYVSFQSNELLIPNNPCKFFDDFQFEITFEVLSPLQEGIVRGNASVELERTKPLFAIYKELEFKVVYVGSAENSDRDQTLQTVMVGPVPVGVSKFALEAKCPDPSLIPPSDALGVTVVLLQCSYRGKEFVRVGYYVNNDYQMLELCENPPSVTNFDLLVRSILAEEPRITRFATPWDNEDNPDLIPEEEVDPNRMDVSGEEEDIEEDIEEEKIEEDITVDNGADLAENDDDENDDDDDDDDDDDEDEDIENVEHDLEEDEEKFKQKRHETVNNVNNLSAISTPTRAS